MQRLLVYGGMVGLLSIASASVGASAHPSRDDGPVVLSPEPYPKLTAEEGTVRLDRQVEGGRLSDLLRIAVPDTYVGRWFDDSNRIVFGFTELSPAASEIVAGSAYADAIDIEIVPYSLAELNDANDWLNAVVDESGDPMMESGIDPSVSKVVLTVPYADQRTSVQEEVIRSAHNELGQMLALEEFPSGYRVTPDACGTGINEDFCDPPLRGGVRYSQDNGPGPCTTGFMAQSRSDPKKYVLTAGHCLYRDGSLIVRTRTANGDLKRLGYWHNGNAGAPGDWAIARISNRRFSWQPSNVVFVRANPNAPIPTTRNELYEIRGDAASEMDDYVCLSGQTSRTVCG